MQRCREFVGKHLELDKTLQILLAFLCSLHLKCRCSLKPTLQPTAFSCLKSYLMSILKYSNGAEGSFLEPQKLNLPESTEPAEPGTNTSALRQGAGYRAQSLHLRATAAGNCRTHTELVMFSNTMVSCGISLSPPQGVQVPMSVSEEKPWCEYH